MKNWTKNFRKDEFTCRCCGDGAESMHLDVVIICQAIRDVIERPIRVTSGYRCYKHNSEVGGATGSYHMSGQAADLYSDIGAAALYTAARALYQHGIIPELKYCIWYKLRDIIHVDIGNKPRERVFVTAL